MLCALVHPQCRREVRELQRVPRPVARGGQDAGVLADGRRDVLEHVEAGAAEQRGVTGHPRAPFDSVAHQSAGRRGLSELHGERVRTSR